MDGCAAVGHAAAEQVLQTLSILIQNIRSETAIFYLFSNNYINELITTKLVRQQSSMHCDQF